MTSVPCVFGPEFAFLAKPVDSLVILTMIATDWVYAAPAWITNAEQVATKLVSTILSAPLHVRRVPRVFAVALHLCQLPLLPLLLLQLLVTMNSLKSQFAFPRALLANAANQDHVIQSKYLLR